MGNNQKKQEEPLNACPIPKNFADSGRCFNGMFRTRNLVEGCIVTAPIAYGLWKIKLPYDQRITLVTTVCGFILLFFIVGIYGDSVTEFLLHVMDFRKRKRVAKYNPRVKNEATPEYLTADEYELPRDKLIRYWKAITHSGTDQNEEISNDIFDPHYKEFYEDDLGVVEKPDELKSKSELRKEKKERKLAAKEKAKQEKAEAKTAKAKAKEDAKAAKAKAKEEAKAAKAAQKAAKRGGKK